MGVQKSEGFGLDQLNFELVIGVFDAFHKGSLEIQKCKYKFVAKNFRISENAFNFVTGGFPERRT